MTEHPAPVVSGPSDAALEAAARTISATMRPLATERVMAKDILVAAFTVDEPRIRADERRRITAALTIASPTVTGLNPAEAARVVEWIERLAREFGSEGGPR